MSPPSAHVGAFLDRLIARDQAGAIALATSLADEGISVTEILATVVAPALAEIGERWHRDEYGVADEHAATAVADAVVSVLTAHERWTAADVRVAVVCAEGEWHLLPARLMAELLRFDGFDVTFLGGSMPAAHLRRYLASARTDVVAISCSTPLALEGVLSSTLAAHEAGVPVIVGGRALGPDDHRARALGADLWAPDPATAAELLRQPLPPALATPTADVAGAIELSLRSDEIVAGAVVELARLFPRYATFTPEQQQRTREDFAFIVSFAATAVLTRDPRVFSEFLEWLDALLQARGLPPTTLELSLTALQAATRDPSLTRLLREAMP